MNESGKTDRLAAKAKQAGLFIFLNYKIYFVWAGYLQSRNDTDRR